MQMPAGPRQLQSSAQEVCTWPSSLGRAHIFCRQRADQGGKSTVAVVPVSFCASLWLIGVSACCVSRPLLVYA